MKELYVPKGVTATYETLMADEIIVMGNLIVNGSIHARRILGHGCLRAKHITAERITARELQAETVVTSCIAVETLKLFRLQASRAAVITGFVDAVSLDTPKLTVYRYMVEELKVKKLALLPDKRGGLLSTVLFSTLRTALAGLRFRWHRASLSKSKEPIDASYTAKEQDEPLAS